MAIYKLDDGTFVISASSVWLAGCYENEKAARFAFSISDKEKEKLQNEAIIKNNGVITWQDIKNHKDKLKGKL